MENNYGSNLLPKYRFTEAFIQLTLPLKSRELSEKEISENVYAEMVPREGVHGRDIYIIRTREGIDLRQVEHSFWYRIDRDGVEIIVDEFI